MTVQGNRTISQLDAVGTLTGAEYLGLVQSTTNYRVTIDNMLKGRPDFYNVRHYGATGDGVTDDTAAINLALAAAVANTGINTSAKGIGTVVFPPGFYATSGLTLSTAYTKLLGLGGRIDALTNNAIPITVAASNCVIENLVIYNQYRPTTAAPLIKQTAGSDCTFRKLELIGGWYGFWGAGGGDCKFSDIKIYNQYSDFIFLQGYQGMWGERLKCDGSWPVQTPNSGNDKGAWVTLTAYALGDVVIGSGSYYFQCSQAGTSGASAPVAALLGTQITDGTAKWKTCFYSNRAGLHIDSGCFANNFMNCDFTGGHYAGVYLTNSLATTAPQSTFFSGLCEFGVPLKYGMWVNAGDHIDLDQVIIDGGLGTSDIGVVIDTCRHFRMRGCLVQGFTKGVQITANSNDVNVAENTIVNNTTGVSVDANATHFRVGLNNVGTSAVWGANTNSVTVAAGTSDYYQIVNNDTNGAVAVSDGGTGVNKSITGNV